MKQIVLDTNFILTCIKQKIDFFEQLFCYEIVIPTQVIAELKRIDKTSLALKILSKNSFKEINLTTGYVDKGIIKFAKENSDAIIATLDKEIQKKIKNYKLIIRGKKKLEII